jgi:hypothetical protein
VDRKLQMMLIALANLVASEEAKIVGMNWHIELGSGNTLFVEPSDEGFIYQVLRLETEEYAEHYGDREELTCVSQLQDLINEVVD